MSLILPSTVSGGGGCDDVLSRGEDSTVSIPVLKVWFSDSFPGSGTQVLPVSLEDDEWAVVKGRLEARARWLAPAAGAGALFSGRRLSWLLR
jgi:hypothetical protein